MDYFVRVEILKSHGCLYEELTGSSFFEAFRFAKQVEQVTTFCIFEQDEVSVLLHFVVEKLDDVWVTQTSVVFNFSL